MTMKVLIFKYLEKHYTLSLKAYDIHELYDKTNKKYKRIHQVFIEMKTVFDVNGDVFLEVFEEWLNKKSIELVAITLELQTKLQLLTGKDIIITAADLDKMTADHNSFMEYIKNVVEEDIDVDYDDYYEDDNHNADNMDYYGLEPIPIPRFGRVPTFPRDIIDDNCDIQ